MKLSAKTIVIDADVGRAAGTTEHPVSKNSRLVLQAILQSDLDIIFCKTLSEEWKKHSSLFSKKWLSSMIAKKRFKLIKAPELIQEYIAKSNLSEEKTNAAIKDAHIVNNALQTDKLIASNDKAARSIFSEIAKTTCRLNDIKWAIPSDDFDDIQLVLSGRSIIPEKWKLAKNHHP